MTLDHTPESTFSHMDTKLRKFLTIGQLGQQADVSIDTIRLYEQRGLLPKPPRTAAGYRLYTIETIELPSVGRHAVEGTAKTSTKDPKSHE